MIDIVLIIYLSFHWAGFLSDVPRHSVESSSHSFKRKDSSNSIASIKEPDIPDTSHKESPVLQKDKVYHVSSLSYDANLSHSWD